MGNHHICRDKGILSVTRALRAGTNMPLKAIRCAGMHQAAELWDCLLSEAEKQWTAG